MSDLISRQAVDELSRELVHITRDKADFLCNFWEGLQKLPSVEPCREADDYENEIADLHNRLDIAEYDKERYKEEITILEAENKGEWIPISERLPEKKVKDYLACCEDGYVATIMYDNGRWLIDGTNVIAWMPLPEPYNADREVIKR